MAKKRKTRKTDNAILPVMRSNAAGIDIGATEIYVAVPADRDAENVRSFPTFTQDLYAGADPAYLDFRYFVRIGASIGTTSTSFA